MPTYTGPIVWLPPRLAGLGEKLVGVRIAGVRIAGGPEGLRPDFWLRRPAGANRGVGGNTSELDRSRNFAGARFFHLLSLLLKKI